MDTQIDILVEVARTMRELEAHAIAKVRALQTGELHHEPLESDYDKQYRAA